MRLFGELMERFPVLHSPGHTRLGVWGLEAERAGARPLVGGMALSPDCPASREQFILAAVAASAQEHWLDVWSFLFLFMFLGKLLSLVLFLGSICASSRPSWITCQVATRTPAGIRGW